MKIHQAYVDGKPIDLREPQYGHAAKLAADMSRWLGRQDAGEAPLEATTATAITR